jgi:hypothetical protein
MLFSKSPKTTITAIEAELEVLRPRKAAVEAHLTEAQRAYDVAATDRRAAMDAADLDGDALSRSNHAVREAGDAVDSLSEALAQTEQRLAAAEARLSAAIAK